MFVARRGECVGVEPGASDKNKLCGQLGQLIDDKQMQDMLRLSNNPWMAHITHTYDVSLRIILVHGMVSGCCANIVLQCVERCYGVEPKHILEWYLSRCHGANPSEGVALGNDVVQKVLDNLQ
jgi:hypothetical protein